MCDLCAGVHHMRSTRIRWMVPALSLIPSSCLHQDAVRVQVALPGAAVHEHRAQIGTDQVISVMIRANSKSYRSLVKRALNHLSDVSGQLEFEEQEVFIGIG